VLRGWLRARGVPDLQAVHLAAVDALLTRWHGQGPVALPGGAVALRVSGTLVLRPAPGGVPPSPPAAREASARAARPSTEEPIP
jgi:tRNA(Ile)-lysidine synthase